MFLPSLPIAFPISMGSTVTRTSIDPSFQLTCISFTPNFVADLRQKTNKHILVAETSRDLINFVRNIFFRLGVKEIQVNWKEGSIDILVTVEPMEIGKAIGKEGRNIKLFRDTVQRFFNIRNLAIKQ